VASSCAAAGLFALWVGGWFWLHSLCSQPTNRTHGVQGRQARHPCGASILEAVIPTVLSTSSFGHTFLLDERVSNCCNGCYCYSVVRGGGEREEGDGWNTAASSLSCVIL
ncbi:unnamed protein product, partial [Ectocarpus sp. 8 AP-2014]